METEDNSKAPSNSPTFFHTGIESESMPAGIQSMPIQYSLVLLYTPIVEKRESFADVAISFTLCIFTCLICRNKKYFSFSDICSYSKVKHSLSNVITKKMVLS